MVRRTHKKRGVWVDVVSNSQLINLGKLAKSGMIELLEMKISGNPLRNKIKVHSPNSSNLRLLK
jgi:hypothetical protein